MPIKKLLWFLLLTLTLAAISQATVRSFVMTNAPQLEIFYEIKNEVWGGRESLGDVTSNIRRQRRVCLVKQTVGTLYGFSHIKNWRKLQNRRHHFLLVRDLCNQFHTIFLH